MMVPATFFDGKTARAHAVTLSFPAPDTLAIDGETCTRRVPWPDVHCADPIASTPRFLCFPDGGRCEVSDGDALDHLLAAQNRRPPPSLAARLQAHARTVAIATLVVVGLAACGFQWALPRLVQRAVASLPSNVERRMGSATLSALDRAYLAPSSLDPERMAELRRRFALLVKASGYTGHTHLIFRALRDNSANAFALPDGTVVMTDQLVNLAANDDEIMAVLAHELGHLHHRHALRRLLQNSVMLVLVTSVTGDTSVIGNATAGLPLALMSAKYSRAFETEADLYALTTLRLAAIPPQTFLIILGRLRDSRPLGQGEPPVYLSSHPATAERLKQFQAAADASTPPHDAARASDSATPAAEPPRDH